MSTRTSHPAHDYDALRDAETPSLDALYHEQSKLSARRAPLFAERIEALRLGLEEGSVPLPAAKSYPGRTALRLQKPRRPLRGSRLDDVLASRRSHRGAFGEAPIPLRDLATVLGEALGLTKDTSGERPIGGARRAWPSAGGLYPLEAYLVALGCASVAPGVYHYDADAHALSALAPCPTREALAEIVLADGALATASAVLVLTGVFERTTAKYGERGYRFVLLEAGHAGQNVLLVAEALGLAALPLGGFFEDALGEILGLDARRESAVHLVLLGSR